MTMVANTPELGFADLTTLDYTAPGNGRWPFVGSIVSGYDPQSSVASGGEFIYLKIPTSLAIPAGTIVQWTGDGTVAAFATTASTGRDCAVAHFAIASDSTNVRYGWFQIAGKVPVLKAAVTVTPDSKLFISGTAGRFTNVSSTGKTFLGLRSANTATVTSTTSTVVCFLNRPKLMGT